MVSFQYKIQITPLIWIYKYVYLFATYYYLTLNFSNYSKDNGLEMLI